jgi:peptidoglycan/LPS O-acetylase OafA/YrhL
MVVVTHATFYASTRAGSTLPVWDVGTQGVPIFFVISGFVMSITTQPLARREGAAWQFATTRLIRIVPLYWALNFLKLVQVLTVPALAFAKPDLLNVLASLLFIPARNAHGEIEAFYGVGWTLNFEMFFYALFAFALACRVRPILLAGAVLPCFSALSLIKTDTWPSFFFLANPLLLDFVWGMVIAEAHMRGVKIANSLSAIAIGIGLAGIFVWPKFPLLGLQYALLVGGIVFLEPLLGARIPRLVRFGGDASYSLYLVHPTVGVAIAVLLSHTRVSSPLIYVVVICVSSCLAAACTYIFFERPVTRFLRAKLLSDREKPSLQRWPRSAS